MPQTDEFYREWKPLSDRAGEVSGLYSEAQTACNRAFADCANGNGPGPTTEQLDRVEALRREVDQLRAQANVVLARFCAAS